MAPCLSDSIGTSIFFLYIWWIIKVNMFHSPMLYLLTFIYVLHILIGENQNNMWHYIAIIFSYFPYKIREGYKKFIMVGGCWLLQHQAHEHSESGRPAWRRNYKKVHTHYMRKILTLITSGIPQMSIYLIHCCGESFGLCFFRSDWSSLGWH